MSGQIEINYDDGQHHRNIEVAGEFTNWQGVPLGHDSGTTYAAVFDGAEAGETYMYKFIVEGEWKLLLGLPVVSDTAGNLNHSTEATLSPQYSSHHGQGSSAAGIAGAGASTGAGQHEPYELSESQVPHSVEKVPGLENLQNDTYESSYQDQNPSQSQYQSQSQSQYQNDIASEPYELTSADLAHSKDTVGDLDAVVTTADAPTVPGTEYGSYDIRETQLADTLDEIRPDASDHIPGEAYGSKSDASAFAPTINNAPNSSYYQGQSDYAEQPKSSTAYSNSNAYSTSYSQKEPYELSGSELPSSMERVPGLAGLNLGTDDKYARQEKDLDPYSLKESEISHPVEKVSGLDQIDRSLDRGTSSSATGANEESYLSAAGNYVSEAGSSAAATASSAAAGASSYLSEAGQYVADASSNLAQNVQEGYESLATSAQEFVSGQGAEEDDDDAAFEDAYDQSYYDRQNAGSKIPDQGAMPGALPFEEKITGHVTPRDVERSTLSALGGDSSKSAVDRSLQGQSASTSAYGYTGTGSTGSSNAGASSLAGSSLAGTSLASGYTGASTLNTGLAGGQQTKKATYMPDPYDTPEKYAATHNTTTATSSSKYDSSKYDSSKYDTTEADAGLDYEDEGLDIDDVVNVDDVDDIKSAFTSDPKYESSKYETSKFSPAKFAKGRVDSSELDFEAAQRAVQDTKPKAPTPTSSSGYTGGLGLSRSVSGSGSGAATPNSSSSYPAAPLSGPGSGARGSAGLQTRASNLSSSSHPYSAYSVGSTETEHRAPRVAPYHHQPIDVTTGFPIDGEVPTGRSNRRRGHHSSGSHGGSPVIAGSSTEHRNAAVIAAAAKASAFAKQDVANISNPPQKSLDEGQGVPLDYVPAKTPQLPTSASPKARPVSQYSGAPLSGATLGSTGSGLVGSGVGGVQHSPLKATSSFERNPTSSSQGLQRQQSQREGGRFRRFFSKLGK